MKENVILSQIVTEKSTNARAENKYVFKVAQSATKVDVRNAIEKNFKVKVLDVNTVKCRGKKRVSGRSIGHTASYKKAYVTLASDQKIDKLEA